MYSSASRREHSPRSDINLDTRIFSFLLAGGPDTEEPTGLTGAMVAAAAGGVLALAGVDLRGCARRARVEGLASGRLRMTAGLRKILRAPVKRRQPVRAARKAESRRAGSNQLQSEYRCAEAV